VNTVLENSIDRIAGETDFSGVVRLSRGGELLFERACGLADRAHGIANTTTARFGIASGTKGFTALAIMSLVAEGSLALDTPVRSVLGDELELIDAGVTVGHLLAHTSGIGDYLDDAALDDIDDYDVPVPVRRLVNTADYLVLLRGHPATFEPGARFEYCNGGFVALALIAEIVSSLSFHDLVAERVFAPAGMAATGFPRSDELPGSAAIGYLPTPGGLRTNQQHLPVRGSGDGGAYSTVGDLAAFWPALFAGKILPRPLVEEMVRPHNDAPGHDKRYGLGFWLRPDRDTVMLEGYDAGVSFRSAYDAASELLYTVMSNTSAGAWPLVELLDDALPELARPG
jgi:CubicO group peptidase (beta-lactamase class C family)